MSAAGARRWLVHVADDLDVAWNCVYGGRPTTRGAAFHVQQAAEKLVKAALTSRDVPFRLTHDLLTLVNGLPADFPSRERYEELERFTPYATAYRYPAVDQPPEEPTSADILAWMEEIAALKAELEASLPPAPERR